MNTNYAANFPTDPEQIQTELISGETLLWSGQPSARVIFHRSDWTAIPFSLMWGGFSIFWELGVLGYWNNQQKAEAPTFNFFVLWGIPFVLMGQYLIWGRFFYIAWKKARTWYGLTNKRIIVVSGSTSRRVTDGYLNTLTSVTITTGPDGFGTIEFGPEPDRQSRWGSFRNNRQVIPMDIDLSRLAFLDIPEARAVYQLIQSQRERVVKATT